MTVTVEVLEAMALQADAAFAPFRDPANENETFQVVAFYHAVGQAKDFANLTHRFLSEGERTPATEDEMKACEFLQRSATSLYAITQGISAALNESSSPAVDGALTGKMGDVLSIANDIVLALQEIVDRHTG